MTHPIKPRPRSYPPSRDLVARIGKGAAAVLVAAAAFVAVAARRPSSRSRGLPASVEVIVRRHVAADDFEGFAGAVREHVAAGRPVTRAALGALASVWFDPSAVAAIKRDLKAAGF